MSIVSYIFIISLSGALLMLLLKMTFFKDRHFYFWANIRNSSDLFIHKSIDGVREKSAELKVKGLLKMLNIVYDSVIPFIERRYRSIASSFYKMHRKLWSFLEYSKHSSKNVSEYLKKISADEVNKDPEL